VEEITKRIEGLNKMLGRSKEYDAGLLEGITALEDIDEIIEARRKGIGVAVNIFKALQQAVKSKVAVDIPPEKTADTTVLALQFASKQLQGQIEEAKKSNRLFWMAQLCGMVRTVDDIIKDLEEDNERKEDAG
jgi:hypothetical protein